MNIEEWIETSVQTVREHPIYFPAEMGIQMEDLFEIVKWEKQMGKLNDLQHLYIDEQGNVRLIEEEPIIPEDDHLSLQTGDKNYMAIEDREILGLMNTAGPSTVKQEYPQTPPQPYTYQYGRPPA